MADDWSAFPVAGSAAPPVAQDWSAFPAINAANAGASASPSASDTAIDVAKQAPSGLAVGLEGMMTGVPRLLNAAGTAVAPYIESAVAKVSPAAAQRMHEQDEIAQKPILNSDQKTEFKPPSVADYLPEPTTEAGKLTRGATSFVPAMAAAPGSLARNVATGLAAGGASEGAGEAFEGTTAEPIARVAAPLVAGVLGAKALTPGAAKLTPQAVIDAGSAAYRAPEVQAMRFDPNAIDGVANIITSDLNQAKANIRLAPNTHAIVDDLRNPINGTDHTIEDFQTTRQLLEGQAKNFNNPTEQRAATIAIKSLDRNLQTLPPSAVTAGDLGAANATLAQGRGDYAAGMAAQRVQTKLDNAELQAASAHSGGNIDNATRQKLRTILTSPAQSRGLTPDELDQLDQVVRGSPAGNVLRATGKVLGGGGGLGSLVTAAEGMHVAGPIGAAAPAAGYAIKKAGDALTTAAANRAVQQILSRAPSAPALMPPQPAYLRPGTAGLVGALTGATLPAGNQKRVPASQLAQALAGSP